VTAFAIVIKYISKYGFGGINMDSKEKVKKLPSCPGVYLMKDSLGSVIYVGKSKNLKNRVGSYFQESKSHSPKVVKLVKNIKDFDHIITDTEFEAFLLENKLIKEIMPIYNKLLKSPKSYSYIKISTNEKYPLIEISDESDKNDGNLYFGPYTNRNTAERGLQGIKEYCRISCTGSFQKASACLNYSLAYVLECVWILFQLSCILKR
jgi:excinuclease ABC subunit C